jgi:hypothetical protein
MANPTMFSSVAMNFKSKKRAILTTNSNSSSSNTGKKVKLEYVSGAESCQNYVQKNLEDVGPDELEVITKYLDTQTCLNLLRTCKEIHIKLDRSPGFWKHLCFNENFHEYTALK